MKKLISRMLVSMLLVCGLQLLFNSHALLVKAKTNYQDVDPNQEQTLPLGLVGRNAKQLDHFIYQTVTPGNKNYRQYLTPTQFGRRYGLANQKVKVLTKYFHQHHLKTYVYPGNLLMTVTGNTKNIEKTFGIQIKQSTTRKYIYQTSDDPVKLDQRVAKYISYVDQNYLAKQIDRRADQSINPNASNSTVNVQLLAKVKDPNITDRSFRKFGRAYNTASLYQNGNGGQHQTVGILSTADFNKNDIRGYWQKYGVNANLNHINKVYVDHNISQSAGNRSETTMDVQQASAMAPDAKINVYIGNDYNNSDLLTAYATAIGKDNVDVISNSFGGFESDLNTSQKDVHQVQLLNQLLKQAAAQGITNLNASGDNGAYAFQDGSQKRSVGIPSDSPYMTAVGGTVLPVKDLPFSFISGLPAAFQLQNDKHITIDHESAWNSVSLIQAYGLNYNKQVKREYIKFMLSKVKTKKQRAAIVAKLNSHPTHVSTDQLYADFLGSGGGFSTLFARPKYQQGVSGVGTYNAKPVINMRNGTINANVKLMTGTTNGRNVPDIAGNASSLTGYSIYFNGHDDLFAGSGTSVITPQIAGMAAVINSAQGKRMGFWNPQIYRFAQQNNSPFTPLNRLDDNNLYYTGQPGKLYNQATGLGTIDFTKLNQAFGADQ